MGKPQLLGYVRCSTGEQAVSGLGIEAQEAAIRAAAGHRWELDGVVYDNGASGRDLRRPGVSDALGRIATGEVDGIAVAKMDRLARSAVDFLDLIEWFTSAGAVLVVLDLDLDTGTRNGKLVAGVMAQVAQWERETIADRTRDALAARRAQGKPISRPAVADHPAVADRIRREHLAGTSWRGIAAGLNADGVPTVRGGACWRVSAVQSAAGYRRPPAQHRRTDLPEITRRRRAAQTSS